MFICVCIFIVIVDIIVLVFGEEVCRDISIWFRFLVVFMLLFVDSLWYRVSIIGNEGSIVYWFINNFILRRIC